MNSRKILFIFGTVFLSLFFTSMLLNANTLINTSQAEKQAVSRYFEQIVVDINTKKYEQYTKNINALVLPEYGTWFLKLFGDYGDYESKEYDNIAVLFYLNFAADLFEKSVKKGMTEVLVEEVNENENPSHYHNKIISRQQINIPIYRVRLVSADDSNRFFDLGFFIFSDHNLYSIGMLRHIQK